MSFDGLEIDMIFLADADSSSVTQRRENKAGRMLIDAGNYGDAGKIIAELEQLKVASIDHVVCRHPDDPFIFLGTSGEV